MQIPQQLPQFEREKALILVLGKNTGTCYFAHNGSIRQVANLREPKPRYSDREGFFKRGAGVGDNGGGAVYEYNTAELSRRFARRVARLIKEMALYEPFDELYLLEPREEKSMFLSYLPRDIRVLLRMTVDGNYQRLHPTDVLGRIKVEFEKHAFHEAPELDFEPTDETSDGDSGSFAWAANKWDYRE